jgi:hypothetical protein
LRELHHLDKELNPSFNTRFNELGWEYYVLRAVIRGGMPDSRPECDCLTPRLESPEPKDEATARTVDEATAGADVDTVTSEAAALRSVAAVLREELREVRRESHSLRSEMNDLRAEVRGNMSAMYNTLRGMRAKMGAGTEMYDEGVR